MGAEALDLTFRPLDHRFEVGDELFVHRVVRGPERVEGGRAGSVENPEHGQVFVGVSCHLASRSPAIGFLQTCLQTSTYLPVRRCFAPGS